MVQVVCLPIYDLYPGSDIMSGSSRFIGSFIRMWDRRHSDPKMNVLLNLIL